MSVGFAHLRVHSDYSFGKSSAKISDLVSQCREYRMPAMCLADIGNLFGSMEFALLCAKNGIQPITGCVIKVDCTEGYNTTGDLLVIAKNYKGHLNLMKLVSNSYLSAINVHEPRITFKELLESIEGLVLLCGMHNSPLEHLINDKEYSDKFLKTLLSKMDSTDLFIEISRCDKNNSALESKLIDIAYDYDIPLVATNPVRYINKDNYYASDVLSCIIENRYVLEENRNTINIEHYFRSPEYMLKLFDDIPEATENSILIAQKCSFMIESVNPLMPRFTANEEEILRKKAERGLREKAPYEMLSKYLERLNFELNIICNMQFPGYFLIVEDFIKWSKEHGISVGPGRGSGVGSLVAWALGITGVDPIKFDLVFERFLNPDRVSLPDFDIDFCQLRRDEVIQYVRNKYGQDKVANIITFGKLQARAVLRDVGRVLQMPYNLIDKICKMIPHNPVNPVTLQEAINMDKALQNMRDEDSDVNKLLEIGLRLEGTHRHVSTHAAGIVIADRPIVELAPLYKDPTSGMPVVQYSLKYVDSAGLVKFDFLGLKTLTVISQTKEIIELQGESIDIENIPLNDRKTYKMLSDGENTGVFQFEGSGIRETVKSMSPDSIHDLIALTSLYRPGPMENIPHYINRKHGREKVVYPHPLLEEPLQSTYGVMVYQDQVMSIAKKLAGYSLAEADLLRRAMGKKKIQEMEKQKDIFAKRAVECGVEKSKATEIFDLIEKFAGYGFNKSHAAAYSIISYQTAYLKANYTVEFFVASINLEIDNSDKINLFCASAKRLNIEIIPPNLNDSNTYCSVARLQGKKKLRLGLAVIKNVGVNLLKSIDDEKSKGGAFKNLSDFLRRCPRLNKRAIEFLAKADAFKGMHNNAAQILANIDVILNYMHNSSNTMQLILFSNSNDIHLNESPEWNIEEKINAEYEALGFYLTEHPLSSYLHKLSKKHITNSIDALSLNDGGRFSIAGVIISVKIRSSKGRGKYAFIQLSDLNGIIDLSIFNEEILYQSTAILIKGSLIFCEVTVRKTSSGIQNIIEKLCSLEYAVKGIKSYFRIFIKDKKAIPILQNKLLGDINEEAAEYVKIGIMLSDKTYIELQSEQELRLKYNTIIQLSKHEYFQIDNE